ncbi:GNAT family N-acetyltransferase [Belliella sp. DSM 107340]|uniref:GNAT family N-acetyltransferase n=1 Tax=Belliella calami TaxID=2923436 RepID=A0ABS9UJY0_9BACT|nr:GNAT family N-acetyltransferase [Belliella calami]MCH7396838.1 GNAT family N-acetyltransferase [Belliella calami]
MIEIHPASENQLVEVQKIAYATWPETFSNILTPVQIDYMLDQMYDLDALKSQIKLKKHTFLLAKEGEETLGFCSFELNCEGSNSVKIHKIYILPNTQGKGIGKKLLYEVQKIAVQNGFKSIYLNVNRFNKQAIEFYLYVGFKEIKKEVIDIGNGFVMDDLVLELTF